MGSTEKMSELSNVNANDLLAIVWVKLFKGKFYIF